MLGFEDEKEIWSSEEEEELLSSFFVNNSSSGDEDDDDSLFSRVILGLVHNNEEEAESDSNSIESFERFINNVSSTSFWSSPPVSSSSESSDSFSSLIESKEAPPDQDDQEEEEEEFLSDLLSYEPWADELSEYTEEDYIAEVEDSEFFVDDYGTWEEAEEEIAGQDLEADHSINFSNPDDGANADSEMPAWYTLEDEDESDLSDASQINSLSTYYTTEEEDENDVAAYQMVIGRSLFEEWLVLREGELLKTPESKSMLRILGDTILSPVATLLLKFHAPSEWRSCQSCGGFIETHCCLYSHEESDVEELEDQDNDLLGLQLVSDEEDEGSTYNNLEHFGFGHDQLLYFTWRWRISFLHI